MAQQESAGVRAVVAMVALIVIKRIANRLLRVWTKLTDSETALSSIERHCADPHRRP
jgi:hypothetical protein